jgi:hypothetical protein
LIDYLWRPRQQRPRLNAHLDALEARRKQLTEDDVKSLGHFFGYDYWPV